VCVGLYLLDDVSLSLVVGGNNDHKWFYGFWGQNNKYFKADNFELLRNQFISLGMNKSYSLINKFKNPNTGFVLCLTLGYFGIDRLYAGDYGIGIIKMIVGICSLGVLGIVLNIYDIFNIRDNIQAKNYNLVMSTSPEFALLDDKMPDAFAKA